MVTITEELGSSFKCPHCSVAWTIPDLTPSQAIGENRNICMRCSTVGVALTPRLPDIPPVEAPPEALPEAVMPMAVEVPVEVPVATQPIRRGWFKRMYGRF